MARAPAGGAARCPLLMMASADVRLPLRVKPLLNGRDNNPIRLAGHLTAQRRESGQALLPLSRERGKGNAGEREALSPWVGRREVRPRCLRKRRLRPTSFVTRWNGK